MSSSQPLRLLTVVMSAILPLLVSGMAATAVAADGNVIGNATTLLNSLPTVPELSVAGQEVHWTGAGVSATVVGIDAKTTEPLLGTARGPLRVATWLIRDHHTDVLTALPQLLARASEAKLDLSTLVLQDGLITGPSLRTDPGEDVIVLPQDIMRKQSVVSEDRQRQVTHLTETAEALDHDSASTGLGELSRGALSYVIGKLAKQDAGTDLDDFTPSFARRAVRHGWLRLWFKSPSSNALVTALEQAVAEAEHLDVVKRFQGKVLRLEQVVDAFGRGGWVFSTAEHVLYATPEIHPEYLGNSMPTLMTVVELPAGADPVGNASSSATAISARSYLGSMLMASWSKADGFHADADRWRSRISRHDPDLVPDCIPPHVLVSALNGDIAGLAVEKGLLRPVQDESHEAAERFVDDAAKLLPDAAHLDLIGEYLFTYIYPSPDAKHPQLFGNRQLKSDVQQTFYQTCANVLGGVMHGDCADIAELYQTITDRQGRNPIIIGLPEHAACAWAQQSASDQPWVVEILQTGPPMHFEDAKLQDCLSKAYRSFDPAMTFDPNGLPLLLRFSGEVSRSEWSLSWRIFKEPAYAKTMIEVQKDWHYETYQRGIATMKKLIADGDDDNANYRELSGLFSFTGQYDLAAQYHRKAIELTSDLPSRMYMTVQLVGTLLGGGQVAQARTAALDVLDRQLPALKQTIGPAYLQVGLELAGTSLNTEGGPQLPDIAMRCFNELLTPQVTGFIEQLSDWLGSSQFNQKEWDTSEQLRPVRTLVAEYVGLGVEAIRQMGHDKLPGDPGERALTTAIQRWIDGIAFHDIEENSMVMDRYATVGMWYGAVGGLTALDRELEAVQPATDKTVVHAARLPGAAQKTRDLPWIRASVPYWYDRLVRLFGRDHETLDASEIARLAKHLQEAHQATVALGLSSARSEIQTVLGEEIAALVAQNDAGLRKVLERVASAGDKGLMDNAAQLLGDTARFLDVEWYGRVLKAWREVVDYKPKYFWIAWRAALNKAPRQALMAAKLAAERFKDDSAFAEEYGYMRTVLAPQLADGDGAGQHAADPVPATPAAH